MSDDKAVGEEVARIADHATREIHGDDYRISTRLVIERAIKASLSAAREGYVMVPTEPTMGQWDDFCAVHHVPFDKFIVAYKAMLPASSEGAAASGEGGADAN